MIFGSNQFQENLVARLLHKHMQGGMYFTLQHLKITKQYMNMK